MHAGCWVAGGGSKGRGGAGGSGGGGGASFYKTDSNIVTLTDANFHQQARGAPAATESFRPSPDPKAGTLQTSPSQIVAASLNKAHLVQFLPRQKTPQAQGPLLSCPFQRFLPRSPRDFFADMLPEMIPFFSLRNVQFTKLRCLAEYGHYLNPSTNVCITRCCASSELHRSKAFKETGLSMQHPYLLPSCPDGFDKGMHQ